MQGTGRLGAEEEQGVRRLRGPRPSPDPPGPAKLVDGAAGGAVGAPGEGGAPGGRASSPPARPSFLILEKGRVPSSQGA